MLSGLRKRAKKAGQAPGTPMYTGTKKKVVPQLRVINFTEEHFEELAGATFEACLPAMKETGVTWVDIEGLNDLALIDQIAKHYKLHPLTVEDILNVEQRPKVEEFDGYLFITLKMLVWNADKRKFYIEQLGIIFGEKFVLTFQESETTHFNFHS
jgi:magnesium transporter